MTQISVDDLFDKHRFPRGRQLVPLCLYFPLGVIVCILRIFIGLNAFVAACLLPRMTVLRSCVLRTMCLVLGVIVFEENVEEKHENAKVVVSNHVTVLDHLAIDLVLSCFMPNVWDLPPFLNWWLGYKGSMLSAKHDQDALVENVNKHLAESTCPVLTYPENETTNGRAGLLKFCSWPFNLNMPVNPVVITVSRPPVTDVALSVLGSQWWSDLLWFLFTPYTLFTFRYLPRMQKGRDEDVDHFAKRVQTEMAKALKITATNYTIADKSEYVKRILCVPVVTRSPTSQVRQRFRPEDSIELIRMAQQVKEVLPYVPLEVIRRDLVRTKSVDMTITNVLEGLVPFVPEPIPASNAFPSPSTASPKASSSAESVSDADSRNSGKSQYSAKSKLSTESLASTSTNLSTAASSFGKTPTERMMSYQERKQQMIDSARQRYIQKHGLQV